MQFSFEFLKNHYKIECGSVYGGEIFAKDGSPHKAVVFYVSKETDCVYTFCITSQEKTIRRFEQIDCKASVVELPFDVIKELYNDDKSSWIYCGKSNIGKIPLDDFINALAEHRIKPYKKLNETLFSEIVLATHASITYSDDDLIEIGLAKMSD